MQFSQYKSPSSLMETLTLRYSLPNGQEKIVGLDVPQKHNYQDANHFQELIREELKRKADDDIRTHLNEGIRDMTATQYQNSYSTQVEGNWDYWSSHTHDGTATANVMYEWGATQYEQGLYDMHKTKRRVTIKFQDGRRVLNILKEVERDEFEITEKDILEARQRWWKEARITVLTKKAERRAEDLLKMFISEIDFRNYKEKGCFTVKQGNKIFRIWRDNHKHIDMWEKRGQFFQPKNRLCVHTPTREVPLADEVLSKILLIRSNGILEKSNHHSAYDMTTIEKEEELLVKV